MFVKKLSVIFKTSYSILGQAGCLSQLFLINIPEIVQFALLRRQYPFKINKITATSSKTWQQYQHEFIKQLGPIVPINFLSKQIIKNSMFVAGGISWQNTQLEFLQKHFSEQDLKKCLREDFVGMPRITSQHYLTSHNSIHQLYHLALFEQLTRKKVDQMNLIIEWGGGYGCLAKVVHRLGFRGTFVILDMPLFSTLQFLYLCSVLGKSKVEFNPKKIVPNKINLVSTNHLRIVEHLKPNLFISMWGLSESDQRSQITIKKSNYLNSTFCFLGLQAKSKAHPYSFASMTKSPSWQVLHKKEISFLPGNFYYIAKHAATKASKNNYTTK